MLTRICIMLHIAVLLPGISSLAQTATCDSTYFFVDEMPKFGESYEDLMAHLRKNLRFGKDCRYDELGEIAWTIDTEGNMLNIDVPRAEGACKSHIVEQLSRFPKWKPGRLNGTPVCVKMRLKICIKPG